MYHVIIIEDDPMVASINKQYVEVTPEFRVDRIFKNGSEALPYLKTNPTDLIILDYYTPVMNGGEFLDALHNAGLERYGYRPLPVKSRDHRLSRETLRIYAF